MPINDLKIFSPEEIGLLIGNAEEDWSKESTSIPSIGVFEVWLMISTRISHQGWPRLQPRESSSQEPHWCHVVIHQRRTSGFPTIVCQVLYSREWAKWVVLPEHPNYPLVDLGVLLLPSLWFENRTNRPSKQTIICLVSWPVPKYVKPQAQMMFADQVVSQDARLHHSGHSRFTNWSSHQRWWTIFPPLIIHHSLPFSVYMNPRHSFHL